MLNINIKDHYLTSVYLVPPHILMCQQLVNSWVEKLALNSIPA